MKKKNIDNPCGDLSALYDGRKMSERRQREEEEKQINNL